MLRLWKSFCKDFRQLYVGSSANVETTNINCGSVSSLSNNEGRNSCIFRTRNQENLNITSSTNKTENSLEDFNNYQRLKFKWNLSKSVFLEICSLSSAIALSWEYGKFRLKQGRLPCLEHSTSLVEVLTSRLLPSINKGVRLTINDVHSNSYVLSTVGDVHTENITVKTPDEHVNKNNTATQISLSITEEINETLTGMLKNLETNKNLGLSEWQNSVGVELINSAKKEEISEYDYLIKNLETEDRFYAYRREAFHCFQESRRLGCVKGAYNLAICYENGIGTSQNLEKSFTHFEEAARNNHPAAQYNLGLLLYQRYLHNEMSQESDLSEAISNLRRAAHHGLEEARSALNFLINDVENQHMPYFTSISPDAGEKNLLNEVGKHGLFIRKAFSEPGFLANSFRYCNNVNHKSEKIPFEFNNGSVSFYFGD